MHLVIHTQYYPPETGAPQARLSGLANRLAENGVQVTVLTGMPNYPKGKLFPGYSGLLHREQIGGVRVIRCWLLPSQSPLLLPRLACYFSFVITSFLIGLFLAPKADYWLTESPPLFLGISGSLLSRMKGARWIFNVSDLWPESAVRLGVLREGPALRISRWLEKLFYQKAWLVSGQSQAILADIKSRFPQVKTYHLSNGADPRLFSPSIPPSEDISRSNGKLVAVYAGLHGLAQGLEQVVYCAADLRDNVDFWFFGDGPCKSELIDLANKLHLDNIKFMDTQEKKAIPGILAGSDVCIVPLKLDLPGAVPSKIYEGMASGRPILLIAGGEASEIILSNHAGMVVQPGYREGIIRAITKLAEEPELRHEFGKSGRHAAEAKFDSVSIADQFCRFLAENLA